MALNIAKTDILIESACDCAELHALSKMLTTTLTSTVTSRLLRAAGSSARAAGAGAGAAATKLEAARKKAGIKERTRIVDEGCKERLVGGRCYGGLQES